MASFVHGLVLSFRQMNLCISYTGNLSPPTRGSLLDVAFECRTILSYPIPHEGYLQASSSNRPLVVDKTASGRSLLAAPSVPKDRDLPRTYPRS
jgi:hypothetical protein